MTRSLMHSLLGLTAAVALFSVAPRATADQVVVATGNEHSETTGPNARLLRSGLWTLGLSYVPSIIVAARSPLAADDNLYIPVAGPWMDYATRDCPRCEHETFNRVMLVTDGIFQGIGALQIVGSFLFLETRSTAAATEQTRLAKAPSFRISPARLDTGAYGLSASGHF